MGKYKEKKYLKILFKHILKKIPYTRKKKLPYFLICAWIIVIGTDPCLWQLKCILILKVFLGGIYVLLLNAPISLKELMIEHSFWANDYARSCTWNKI
jgi:hypothetical protein